MTTSGKQKSKGKRGQYADQFELAGISPLSLNDCIHYLQKIAYHVDHKNLHFHRKSDRYNIFTVEGHLAPYENDRTYVMAKAHVVSRFAINYTVVIPLWWIISMVILLAGSLGWSWHKLLIVFSSFIIAFATWLLLRATIYYMSYREAKHAIQYLRRGFDI